MLTTIPFSPRVRPLQNETKMPVVMDDDFGKGIRSLIAAFYPNLTGAAPQTAKRGKSKSFFGLRLNVT